jgi:hypothetical protein
MPSSRVFATAILSTLMLGAAHAQAPGVAVPLGTPGYSTDRSAAAAETRKDKRQQGKVKKEGGDTPPNAATGAIGTDKAATAGEKRKQSRDQRRPGRRKTTQGGTPI